MGFREAAKKRVLFVIAGTLWPYPPPPSELNGSQNFFSSVPKVQKKVIFTLMARPPPPLYGPAI